MKKVNVPVPTAYIDANPVDEADEAAVKALAAGIANENQQKRVLDLIVMKLAGTYDTSYRPGGPEADRAACFAEGKRYVGNALVGLTKVVKQK